VNQPLNWITKKEMKMKILKIEDTRDYEEGPNDRWIAIPGSGIENECGRCNKLHEVHVTIQDGEKVFIVGTGCARKEDMISDKQAKSGTSTAKTIAKLTPQIETLKAKVDEWDQVYREEVRNWQANDYKEGNKMVPYKKTRVRLGYGLPEYDGNFNETNPVGIYKKYKRAVNTLARAEKKMAKIIIE